MSKQKKILMSLAIICCAILWIVGIYVGNSRITNAGIGGVCGGSAVLIYKSFMPTTSNPKR
jgi:hypothetical protein